MSVREKISDIMDEIKELMAHVKEEFQRLRANIGDSKLIQKALAYIKGALSKLKSLFDKHISPKLKQASGQAMTQLTRMKNYIYNNISKMRNHVLTAIDHLKNRRTPEAEAEVKQADKTLDELRAIELS